VSQNGCQGVDFLCCVSAGNTGNRGACIFTMEEAACAMEEGSFKRFFLLFSAILALSSFLVLFGYMDLLFFFFLFISSDLFLDKTIAENIVYSSHKPKLSAGKVI